MALDTWAQENVADPWLIASAAVNGYTLVTFEKPVGMNRSKRSPSKNAKIPDIALEFGVPVIDLYEMMKRLSIKL